MKKIISLSLAALMGVSALAACAPAPDQLDPAITLASSDAVSYGEWLDERLETIPDDIVLGVGSNAAYGVDMTNFESDGYILREIDGQILAFGATGTGLDRAVREYAQAAENGISANLDTVYHEGYRIEKLTVADRDISEFSVVYNDNEPIVKKSIGYTHGNAQLAADELIRLVAKATGITLQKFPHTAEVEGPVIMIDYLEETPEHGDDRSFAYEVKDGNLYINGMGDSNGCVNGVYYFLQEECGWYALIQEGDSSLSESDHVDIPEGTANAVDPLFDYSAGLSSISCSTVTFKYERSVSYSGKYGRCGHGLNTALRSIGYVDVMVCHTDEEIYETVLDYVVKKCESTVAAGLSIKEDLTFVDLSYGDTMEHCLCKTCANVYKQEGRVHSGTIVRFANRVCNDLDLLGYGDLTIGIFAYFGTEEPCKTAPDEMIQLCFAPTTTCANHPLEGSECFGDSRYTPLTAYKNPINNSDIAEYLKGWHEMTDNIYLWYYPLTANFNEYTNYYQLYSDLHFLAENGVRGFYVCGGYGGVGIGRLRYQIMDWIIWHPEATEEEFEVARDEIMRREYGESYEYIKKYIELWHSTEIPMGCWNAWDYYEPVDVNSHKFDQEMYAGLAEEMFTLIETSKGGCVDAAQENRLDLLELDVIFKQCQTNYDSAVASNDTEFISLLEERWGIFWNIVEKNGLKPRLINGGFLNMQKTLSEDLHVQFGAQAEETETTVTAESES